MKILLCLAFAALPLAAFSQNQAPPAASQRSFEIGLSAVGGAYRALGESYVEGFGGASLRVLRNSGRFQFGLSVDGYAVSSVAWSLNPALMANYRLVSSQAYWYGGVMAGYTKTGAWPQFSGFSMARPSQGYQFGLQAGYVREIGKRLSFNTELAVRSVQTWDEYQELYPEYLQPGGCVVNTYTATRLTSRLYVPVSVGLRYRL